MAGHGCVNKQSADFIMNLQLPEGKFYFISLAFLHDVRHFRPEVTHEMIPVLQRLRSGSQNSAVREACDEEVLKAAPAIVSGENRGERVSLLEYLEYGDQSATQRAFIQEMADQNDSVGRSALADIMERGHEQDLPWLTNRLSGPIQGRADLVSPRSLKVIADEFKHAALPLLRQVMNNSPSQDMRDVAAVLLAKYDDPEGMKATLAILTTGSQERRSLLLGYMQGWYTSCPPHSAECPVTTAYADPKTLWAAQRLANTRGWLIDRLNRQAGNAPQIEARPN